jgi:hypothetical protein
MQSLLKDLATGLGLMLFYLTGIVITIVYCYNRWT